MGSKVALRCLLEEMGVPDDDARRIERVVDRHLSQKGGSDWLAGAILQWSSLRIRQAFAADDVVHDRLAGTGGPAHDQF